MEGERELPVTAYVVLALLAEGEAHGYDLQRQVHDRGFRFWTQIQRSSIYNALKRLEKEELVEVELREGGGPTRKVYRLTERGVATFKSEAITYLSAPDHPRDEVDLGVLGLPFLELTSSRAALEGAIALLRQREAFVSERLEWCRERNLELPALNFERPLLTIRADLVWLEKLRDLLDRRPEPFQPGEWASYQYLKPPYVSDDE
jgi:DNA-binding PadR family transcriptional regulator